MPSQPSGHRTRWLLLPYVAPSGRSQVLDFLDGLRESDFDRFAYFHEVLKPQFESTGPFEVGPPHWEGLGRGLFEIRWARCRIYCSVEPPKLVVMYLGLVKRWRRFEPNDRKICDRNRSDFLSDGYDTEKREYMYRARQRRRTNGFA